MDAGMKMKVAVPVSLVVNAFVFAYVLYTTDSSASDDTKEMPVDLDNLDKVPSGNNEKEVEINLDDLEEKPTKAAQGEEAVDLDDLDGEEAEAGEAFEESYLPVNTDDIEPKTNSFFILSVLGVLLPVVAMLFPPRRKKNTNTKR